MVMGGGARRIAVDIVGNAASFKRATADATGSANSFGSKLGSALKVAGAATLAVGAITAVGAAVFGAGAKMEALDAKAKTVFGSSLGRVQTWAKENAAAMGLTAREATGLAANIGDLLVPLGFTRDQAAGMATDIAGLSGALSEWSGGTRNAAEVSAILQKALLGEREGLKELGIAISEADVQAQLAKDGTDKLTGAALAQAKAQATQTLIMAKSTDAQAAYEKGTAKGIRAQHEMEAQLGEVKEVLIGALYPVLTKVAGFLSANLPGAIKFVGKVFDTLGPIIGVIIAVIGKLLGVMGKIIEVGAAIARKIGGIFGTIADVIRGAVNTVIDIINGAIRGINSIRFTTPEWLPGDPVTFGANLGYIPRLHRGGVVPGPAGAEVLTMLQAGERVSPAGAGGAGIVINIENFTGSDADIDRLADRLAMRLRLQGA